MPFVGKPVNRYPVHALQGIKLLWLQLLMQFPDDAALEGGKDCLGKPCFPGNAMSGGLDGFSCPVKGAGNALGW